MSNYPIPRSNYNSLKNLPKDCLIEEIRILENNWQGALDFNDVQANYIKFLYDNASDEVKKKFIEYCGSNAIERSDILIESNKKKKVYLRDVKPGQEFYFATDMKRNTCVSYGRLPSGRYSVVDMCKSPDSNYGTFPGESEVCLVNGE